jgi:CxC2 like cysteine cluster associated with KDZ transposases
MEDFLRQDSEDQWVDDDDQDPLLGQWERFERDVMVVVDCGVVHQRRIQWCHCSDAPERHIQLLQHGLYPASLHRPKTAFTFQVLQYFWIDAVECKTSAMNFFSKLRRLTNYSMPHRVPVSIT